VNYYSASLPSNGNYCLYWSGFSQYNAIGFNFVPDKDLSRLVSENYALDFIVRGDEPGIRFEIRFRDTKTAVPGDHPWRMGTTIDESDAAWDRKWHHVRIPLASFTERGAWDDGAWYNPEGKFDWSKVDRLEVSTEWTDIIGKKVWFDNIHISNLDTAIVRVTEPLGIKDKYAYGKLDLKIAPNPMHEFTEISFLLEDESCMQLEIFSVPGIRVRTIKLNFQYPGYQSIIWDGRSDNGLMVMPGMYLCRIITKSYSGTAGIIKNN
jgi:endoglucanase